MKTAIEHAKEAGLLADDEVWVSPYHEAMERLVANVRAEALEEAAQVCDGFNPDYIGAATCAAAIRGLK